MKSRVLLSSLLSLSLFGCDGVPGVGDDDDGPSCEQEAPAEAPACGRVGGVIQVYEATHPGRGSEVALRVLDRCGGTLPATYAECLDVPSGAQVAQRTLDPGHTMILVENPRSDEDRGHILAALDAIFEARPTTERLAIHLVGSEIRQVSDFTRDRARLAFLASEAIRPTEEQNMDLSAAVLESRDAVQKLGNNDELSFRGVIVLSKDAPGADALAMGESVVAHVALGGAAADDMRKVSEMFDEVISHGVVGVGICGADALSVNGVEMELADFLPEENNLTCDAARAAAGDRAYAKRIEFVFSPEERATWQNLMSVRSKDNWATSVKMGEADPIPAIAHLRGHGTMLCDRKSYSVNLEAPEGGKRPLMPGSRDDEFFLLSMCWDQMYVENYLYYTLWTELDFIPFKFDYVELVVDGENLGIYLMVEKPHEAIKSDQVRPIGVARRNHEGEGDRDEFKYFKEGAREYMKDEYYALIDTVQNNSGEALVTELNKRLSLDHYLRFVAMQTAFHSGDYGDEVRFTATERIDSAPNAHWTISGWDPEDMFRLDCVWEQYAFYDENGLVWCAEGVLENNVLADPTLYGMYVDHLEKLLDELSIERFDAAAARTKERVMPFWQSAEIRSAMVEMDPPAATAEEAEKKIDSRFRIIRERWVDWHQELRTKIAAYRGM